MTIFKSKNSSKTIPFGGWWDNHIGLIVIEGVSPHPHPNRCMCIRKLSSVGCYMYVPYQSLILFLVCLLL